MSSPTAESRLAGFIDQYTAEIATILVECRAKLRALFPQGYELVFDNYNALVIGFSPSEKTRASFLSIAGYPRWVNLFFLHGATLADPDKLLQGSGSQVRSVKLRSAADLDQPAIRRLIDEARAEFVIELEQALPLQTVIKMAVAKQRSRRPPEPAQKKSPAKRRPAV